MLCVWDPGEKLGRSSRSGDCLPVGALATVLRVEGTEASRCARPGAAVVSVHLGRAEFQGWITIVGALVISPVPVRGAPVMINCRRLALVWWWL